MGKKRKVPKQKRKRTAAEKRAKRERQQKYQTIFINGKQKRILRPQVQLVEGIPVDEFIANNADPIWLHQNELWELMPPYGEF
jgi:hypothetical protein